jgi:hypothetical protein
MNLNYKTVKPFTEAQLAALYSNQELNVVEVFVNEFVECQLRNHAIRQQHKLHELLMNYLRVRNHLIVNSHELESLKKACKETQKQLWCLDKASLTETGKFCLLHFIYFLSTNAVCIKIKINIIYKLKTHYYHCNCNTKK